MSKQAYYRGLSKQSGFLSDTLLGIAPNILVPPAAVIGSHIGQLDTPTKQQIQQWDSHKARALLPGVSAYRLNSRRRGASKGKTAPIVHETYGGVTAPILMTGAGALIGGALGGTGGAGLGALAGIGASTLAKLIGVISGLVAKKRSKAEQQEADKVVAAKYILPGYAQYAQISGAKSADRIAQEQAKQQEAEGKHTKQASLRRLLKHATYLHA